MTLFESQVPLRRPFALLASLSVALVSGTAFAQSEPRTGDVPGPGAEGAAATAPPPAGGSPLAFVESLPASAYPSSPTRGIYGGSLWRTFHGLQWPYMPKTALGISGDAWVDTGYEHVDNGAPNEASAKYFVQQARVVLRATPTWSNGEYFVQGQVELVGNNNATQSQTFAVAATTDDAWVRLGRWTSWDVQVGRFQFWEIYHVGMGLDLFTQERNGAVVQNELQLFPPAIYVVNDQADLRAIGTGQAALHFYPFKSKRAGDLRFEIGSQFGSSAQNTVAVRPVAIYDVGWLKLKFGGSYEVQNDQTDTGKGYKLPRGIGGAIQFVLDPYVEFGANASYGLIDVYSSKDGSFDAAHSNTTYSVGGFLNVQPLPTVVPDLLLGAGYNYTYLEDQLFDPALNRHGKFRQQQGFVALQYYLWRQLFIKAVVGYAAADFAPTPAPTPYSNTMVSGRLRLEYLF